MKRLTLSVPLDSFISLELSSSGVVANYRYKVYREGGERYSVVAIALSVGVSDYYLAAAANFCRFPGKVRAACCSFLVLPCRGPRA
jgi:hypothetical protein